MHLRYHHSSMTKSTYCTLILALFIFLCEILFCRSRSISNRNIKTVLKSIRFENVFDLLFLSFYREGSIIADISLTFDEPVGESEVETLLLQAINDGSLGTLKVDNISVRSIISGLCKLWTTVIWCAPNASWVCDLRICTTDMLSLWWKLLEATLLTLSSCDKHLCDFVSKWVSVKQYLITNYGLQIHEHSCV